MVKDENSSKMVLDVVNNEECIVFGCRENNGSIKKEWVYKGSTNLAQITNFFSINKELLNNSLSIGIGEIGIKMHKEKTDCYFENKGEENIWKLSVILKNTKPKPKEELKQYLQKFIWEGKKIETNDAMFQSFYSAILDASVIPENKTIYTYYIKSYN